MTKATTCVIDLDLFKYTCASAGEKRSVIVTHKSSGRQIEVKSRTAFYGHHLKKEGGKLAEINSKRDSPFAWDEFTYEDKQTPDKIENVLHTAKVMVQKDLEASGATKHIAILGEGDSFRVGLSTLLKYKDRGHLLKPVYLQEVSEYLRKKFDARVVRDIEADDAVVIECFNRPDRFALIEDKDFWGCPIKVWDRNQQHRGIVNCRKFGHLFLDSKKKIRGEGRLFFYWQCLSEDSTDVYKANCFSDIKWGQKSAYNALVDCRDDKEALQTLVDCFKRLYPEPKIITGWRGDDIEIDWLYVLSEMWHMARMLRTYDELENKVEVVAALDNLGINYK